MNGRIKHTPGNAEGEWRVKLLWYLDHGCSAPTRKDAVEEIAQLLERSPHTVVSWVKRFQPHYWRMILQTLEAEFGPVPESVWPGESSPSR